MFKQVMVIRADLKLSRGKIAAQCAHGAVEAYRKADKRVALLWQKEGSKKVVLKAKDLKELLLLKEKCDSLKLPNALISDAGLTETKPGTITVLGIGPQKDEEINKVTGSLPLLK